MHEPPELTGFEASEFVCTDAPPPCDDPNGTPAWQQAKKLGAAINEPRRKQRLQQLKRARAHTADPTARTVLAAHVQDTQHQLAQDRALLRGVAPASLPAGRPRVARPRGAGRPRARRTTSSRAGPSDDSGGSEPPGETAGHHLHLVPDPAPRGGTYSYGCLSAEERGADVEPVIG